MRHYHLTPEGQQEKALAEKFGLLGEFMINPDLSYEDLTEPPATFEKRSFGPLTFYDHFSDVNLDLATKELNIKIDLSKVNSFEALGNEVKRLVDFELNHKGRPLKERKYFKPGGIHSKGKDLFDILLTGRTYREMQAQQKCRVTYKQLAERLNPKAFKIDQEGQRRKAETTFHEYERLVKGDYREITYP